MCIAPLALAAWVRTTHAMTIVWSPSPDELQSWLDTQHAWRTDWGPGSDRPARLLATNDGGATWRRIRQAGLIFRPVRTSLRTGAVQLENDLRATSDGGRTWRAVTRQIGFPMGDRRVITWGGTGTAFFYATRDTLYRVRPWPLRRGSAIRRTIAFRVTDIRDSALVDIDAAPGGVAVTVVRRPGQVPEVLLVRNGRLKLVAVPVVAQRVCGVVTSSIAWPLMFMTIVLPVRGTAPGGCSPVLPPQEVVRFFVE
jgi:hypothetical protein